MYPQPKNTGGILIRRMIGILKKAGISLPIQTPVWIGVSGGPDSLALAHLLTRYGRRVVAKDQIRIFHVNHHWRGAQSDKEARMVEKCAAAWGVPFQLFDLDSAHLKKSESPENAARSERKKIFQTLLKQSSDGMVLTAHHADDVVETVLWRLMTGQISTHSEGVRLQHESEVRPLLNTRKTELLQYLKEEKLKYYIDATNLDPKYLRGKIRRKLVPLLDEVFPRWSEHFLEIALESQGLSKKSKDLQIRQSMEGLIAFLNPQLRRGALESLASEAIQQGASGFEILPGLKISCDFAKDSRRWILTDTREK